MKNYFKQVSTERGLIYVVREVENSDEARREGYSYSFTSRRLDCDVYGKCLDKEGHRHEFVLVKEVK